MAITQSSVLPQQYISQLGQDYGQQLAGLTSIPLDTSQFAPTVAAQDPLQAQAATLAGLQQQGFGQAQQARQQDYLNQMGLSQAQQGLGQYQTGLGQQTQALGGVDVGLAGQVGGAQQAQTQAVLDAQREANRMTLYEPYERLGFFGQGLTGLMGGYPAQYQSQITPNPSPLQSALGIGATLGGIYGNIRGTRT